MPNEHHQYGYTEEPDTYIDFFPIHVPRNFFHLFFGILPENPV